MNELLHAEAPAESGRRARDTASIATVAVAAFLSLLALIRYGLDSDGVVAVFTISVLVVLSRHDLEERRIPNRIVLPALGIVLLANVALRFDHALEWVVACVAAGGFFFVLAIARRGALGFGDVKLAAFLGAALGEDVVAALVIGTLAAAVVGIAILVREGAAGRKRTIPLGPFLAAGAIVVLLFL